MPHILCVHQEQSDEIQATSTQPTSPPTGANEQPVAGATASPEEQVTIAPSAANLETRERGKFDYPSTSQFKSG